MKTPTLEEMMQAYDHAALAKRVIELELAFAKLMELPCSPEQAAIIKDAFPPTVRLNAELTGRVAGPVQ